MNAEHSENHNGLPVSKGTVIACVVLVTVGFLMYTGHTAHLLGFAPYLFLLACPLMHIFMHGGHHHHSAKPGEEHSHGGGGCCGGGHEEKSSDSAAANKDPINTKQQGDG
ncbi:MAG TPA: DUF2933 domain-containing protein [Pseudomonadales bacterium]|nr:DUF2933 domain-containing protein [Pseudomonadales bacterium]